MLMIDPLNPWLDHSPKYDQTKHDELESPIANETNYWLLGIIVAVVVVLAVATSL